MAVAVALAVVLPHADYYVGILEPYQKHNFEFGIIREGLKLDLEVEAEEAHRIGETERAERLASFALDQDARPSSGPETWDGIVADVERARLLIAGE